LASGKGLGSSQSGIKSFMVEATYDILYLYKYFVACIYRKEIAPWQITNGDAEQRT